MSHDKNNSVEKRKVLIIHSDPLYDQMFVGNGWDLTDSIYEADLVCFTGGTDVGSTLYKESRHVRSSFSDSIRDEYEAIMFDRCVHLRIPMVGICRGSQFLCVMNGGSLVQHMLGHCGPNHDVMDKRNGGSFEVTSSHHQMMIPNSDLSTVLLTTPSLSPSYELSSPENVLEGVTEDIEGVFWEGSNSLGVQFHPEWMGVESEASQWFFKGIDELLFKIK